MSAPTGNPLTPFLSDLRPGELAQLGDRLGEAGDPYDLHLLAGGLPGLLLLRLRDEEDAGADVAGSLHLELYRFHRADHAVSVPGVLDGAGACDLPPTGDVLGHQPVV